MSAAALPVTPRRLSHVVRLFRALQPAKQRPRPAVTVASSLDISRTYVAGASRPMFSQRIKRKPATATCVQGRRRFRARPHGSPADRSLRTCYGQRCAPWTRRRYDAKIMRQDEKNKIKNKTHVANGRDHVRSALTGPPPRPPPNACRNPGPRECRDNDIVRHDTRSIFPERAAACVYYDATK